LSPLQKDFYKRPALCRLIGALGGEARFVGGAVRDWSLGLPVRDIDIAAFMPPPRVLERLSGAGYAVRQNGARQGSITVLVGDALYPEAQITSLRRDVSCDGRRAEIAYTDKPEEDALRRDFTVNALYMDINGALWDYVGGAGDLAAGRLKFIGDPEKRCREDYLRILRLFRFYATLPLPVIDANTLDAVAACGAGVKSLSVFRKHAEMSRLCAGRYGESALRAIYAVPSLKNALALPGEEYPADVMRRLFAQQPAPSLMAVLAALCEAAGKNATDPCDTYFESKKDRAAWRRLRMSC